MGGRFSIMRKETQNGELIRHAITRFVMHFLALESTLKHQNDLQIMIVARERTQNFSRLRGQDKEMTKEISSTIHGDEY